MQSLSQHGLRALVAPRGASTPMCLPSTSGRGRVAVQVVKPETPVANAKDGKSDRYSIEMQKKMGTVQSYCHEDGLNYNRILPDLIVGSCLQTPEDLDWLVERENVRTIFCLQEDPDMEYFNLDLKPILARCTQKGVDHVRFPIRDFDAFDLRRRLPKAVARLARSHDPSQGTVYIHCTAGLGRAPAAALAYMNWVRGYQLDAAFALLRAQRMCSPRVDSIRSATVDLLLGTEPVMASIRLARRGLGSEFKVAGLDFGWHKQEAMTVDPATGNLVLERMLQPGMYQYKFVVDGMWSYSADHPSVQDGANTNNVLQVIGRSMQPEDLLRLQRLLAVGQDLTPEERAEVLHMLCPAT